MVGQQYNQIKPGGEQQLGEDERARRQPLAKEDKPQAVYIASFIMCMGLLRLSLSLSLYLILSFVSSAQVGLGMR